MKYYGVIRERGHQKRNQPLHRHADEFCRMLIASAEVWELPWSQAKRRKPCRWCCSEETW